MREKVRYRGWKTAEVVANEGHVGRRGRYADEYDVGKMHTARDMKEWSVALLLRNIWQRGTRQYAMVCEKWLQEADDWWLEDEDGQVVPEEAANVAAFLAGEHGMEGREN